VVTNRIRGAGAAAGASRKGWRLGLVMVLLPLLTTGLMAVSGLDRSHAVANGQDAPSPQGQVRVQDDLGFLGSGTLVASNWVLTVRHIFEHPDDPRRYSIVFGTVDGTNGSSANVRVVEDIVPREGTDLALVRFAPEVTAGTFIPPLATQAPQRYEPAHVYGWGMPQNGSQPLRLRQGLGIVIDPAATANDAYNAEQSPLWRTVWPETPPPMVLGAAVETGDSGGGALIGGRLAGVLVGEPQYHYFNQQGEVVDREFHPAWEIPVWGHLDWIRRTINGEGSSGSNAEAPRRRLGEVPTAPSQDSPLLPPGPESACEPSGGCSPPDPTWNLARLSGVQGAVAVGCAADSPGGCAFGGSAYAAGASTTLALGTRGGTGVREVLVWCTARPEGSAAPKLKISFTNADVPGQQVGRGWWLTTQDFLTTRITNASAC
jgi:Trypsin